MGYVAHGPYLTWNCRVLVLLRDVLIACHASTSRGRVAKKQQLNYGIAGSLLGTRACGSYLEFLEPKEEASDITSI